MGDNISEDEVRHAAKLGRLKLSDERVHFFAEQLSHVLSHIQKLTELDVEGVEPMAHPTDMTNRWRSDEPGPTLPIEDVLANAPEADPPFFKAPKVLVGGAGA